MKKTILTGDRPTGKLHIGHLIGSLQNRVKLQDEYNEYILMANIQAFTDNFLNPQKVRDSIPELIKDYYAVGIDFDKAHVIMQSEIPEIHEIFIYLSNFATIQQIAHNPTVKTEIIQKKYGESTPLGFYMYPIHQIADIACVRGNLIPVGPDQVPIVEDCREVMRKFNRTYNTDVLVEPEALVGISKNVPGIDGNEKMGKSLNNAIYLSDTEEELKKKVMSMKTDPNRIHATDPGQVEGNTVFTYHDIFNTDKDEVADLKERYTKGTVGDVEVKQKLFTAMHEMLLPIRERRLEAEKIEKDLFASVIESSNNARKIAREVADQMKDAMMMKF